MKQVALLTALSLALVIAGCSSKELTRSKAAKIIRANVHFPDPVTDTMQMGDISIPQTTVEGLFSTPRTGPYLKALSDRGLVKFELKKIETGPAWLGAKQAGLFSAKVTDKGNQYLVGPPPGGLMTGGPRVVKMCDREFDTVTGITMVQPEVGGGAKVEYTWKFDNKTPFEEVAEQAFGAEKTACGPNAQHTGAVLMKLYDDGWRFESVIPNM
jgi:hypothetical protein